MCDRLVRGCACVLSSFADGATPAGASAGQFAAELPIRLGFEYLKRRAGGREIWSAVVVTTRSLNLFLRGVSTWILRRCPRDAAMHDNLRPLLGFSVVFDLDGTLVDTAPDLLSALNHVLPSCGLAPVAPDAVRHLVGHGASAMIRGAAAGQGATLPDSAVLTLTDAFVEHYAGDIAAHSRPFPGLELALDDLAADGAVLAVCTNKRLGLAKALLESLGLADRFRAVLGSDSVANRKPHPDHLLRTIHEAGGAPNAAVFVGDGMADLEAARAASVPFIPVSFGYDDALRAEATEQMLDTFEALVGRVRTLQAQLAQQK